MDNKTLLAFVLIAIIMLYFFYMTQPVQRPDEEQKKEEIAEETIEKERLEKEIRTEEEIQERKIEQIVQEEIELQDYIVIQNDVIKTVWTNEGAALKSAILTEFKNPERTQDLELLKPSRKDSLPLSIDLLGGRYQSKSRRYKVVERGINKVVFTILLENGTRITKNISLQDGKYYFDVVITLENTTDSDIATSYSITTTSGVYPEEDPYHYGSGLASVVGIDMGRDKIKAIHVKVEDMPDKNESVGIFMVRFR